MTREQRLTLAYRNTFTRGDGREVLKDLLVRLNFFACNLSSPAEVERRNVAQEILSVMGVLDVQRSNETVDALVDGLMGIPVSGLETGVKSPKDKEEDDERSY